MAVPRRRNAIVQQQSDSNAPPHLRRLDAALGNGDANALRHALGNTNTTTTVCIAHVSKIG